MRLIGLAVILTLSFTLAPLAAEAQQGGKVWRIGVLVPGAPPAATGLLQVLRQGLRELGYVEGRNIVFEFRFAETPTLIAESAAELVSQKVDVIVAITTLPTLAAKRATTTIPIVMVASADPIARGLVASLARPGGNVTGSTALTSELSTKQLELLKEIAPRVSRIPVFWNSTNPAYVEIWRDTQIAAQTLAITLESVDLREASALESAFAAVLRYRAEAVLVMPDPILFPHFVRIAEFAIKNHLPSISLIREFAAAGGLMSYGPNAPDMFRRAATYIDKIFKGAKPADLPIEQPTKFELVINLKTAKALGLTIPPSVLGRADQVIE
jgi:ABC-type uncharacterized transport system substrate-binding protein